MSNQQKTIMTYSVRLLIVLAVIAVLSCDDGSGDATPVCEVRATVRDMRGLDGCNFVFELEDGTRLDPYVTGYCGTPPLPKEITEDPLYNFEFIDGKKVKISYQVMADMATVCMTGTPVKITCLTEERMQGSDQ
ncbi:MAG TPA: hypothetical protein VGD65_04265 [Chryseosolibacter sp.]